MSRSFNEVLSDICPPHLYPQLRGSTLPDDRLSCPRHPDNGTPTHTGVCADCFRLRVIAQEEMRRLAFDGDQPAMQVYLLSLLEDIRDNLPRSLNLQQLASVIQHPDDWIRR